MSGISAFVKDIPGLPRWLSGKESACQWGRCRRLWFRRCRFSLWVRKIPWRRKWQLTLVFLPGKFHGQRSLVDYNPLGHKAGHNWAYAHTKEIPKNSPSPFCHVRTQLEDGTRKQTFTGKCSHLILGFLASRTVRNKFLLFTSHLIYDILVQQHELSMTEMPCWLILVICAFSLFFLYQSSKIFAIFVNIFILFLVLSIISCFLFSIDFLFISAFCFIFFHYTFLWSAFCLLWV